MALKRYNDINGPAVVFVTTTVKNWLPVFSLPDAAQLACRQLRETTDISNVKLIGYVVMPSHIHVMMGFLEVGQLTKVVQSYKSLTSRQIKTFDLGKYRNVFYEKGHFQLWKRRFDDFVVIAERQFRIKLEYIHTNPVRAGLVTDPCVYMYSSASDWLENRRGIISIDKDFDAVF